MTCSDFDLSPPANKLLEIPCREIRGVSGISLYEGESVVGARYVSLQRVAARAQILPSVRFMRQRGIGWYRVGLL